MTGSLVITAIAIALAYLIGSVGCAILVSRLLGLPDPRRHGSGNPGTTNVLRLGGRTAAALVLVGDFLKGTLPVLAAWLANIPVGGVALVGLAAFLGHLYPVFFRLQGGKGVATGLGVFLGWGWPIAIAAAVTWLVVALGTRYSSLAALLTFLIAPLPIWLTTGSPALTAGAATMTIFLVWRHRGNIQRLATGTESKLALRS